jgi:hypothetical protein
LKPKSPEDLGTGDIHAAPGSILSQYTLSPQEQAGDLATTESESGQPLKREEYISSADRKRERMMKISMWGFLFGLVGGGVYLGRPLEEEERERMGWAEVSLPITRLTLVTIGTFTHSILATIPETRKVYACCNSIDDVIDIVFQ